MVPFSLKLMSLSDNDQSNKRKLSADEIEVSAKKPRLLNESEPSTSKGTGRFRKATIEHGAELPAQHQPKTKYNFKF